VREVLQKSNDKYDYNNNYGSDCINDTSSESIKAVESKGQGIA